MSECPRVEEKREEKGGVERRGERKDKTKEEREKCGVEWSETRRLTHTGAQVTVLRVAGAVLVVVAVVAAHDLQFDLLDLHGLGDGGVGGGGCGCRGSSEPWVGKPERRTQGEDKLRSFDNR